MLDAVTAILAAWNGRDAADKAGPREIAARIHALYERHISELEAENAETTAYARSLHDQIAIAKGIAE